MGDTVDGKPAGNGCKSLPDFSALKTALEAATATETSGLNNQMWGTIVDREQYRMAGTQQSSAWITFRVWEVSQVIRRVQIISFST